MVRPNIHSTLLSKALVAVIVLFTQRGSLLLAAVPNGIQLQNETVNAWEEYIRSVDSRMQDRSIGEMPFLWIDESGDRDRRIAQGEILVAPALSQGTRSVPNGLIHHWIGGVFIPGITIGRLSSVISNYGNYKQIYKPVVADSKILGCSGSSQQFSMRWLHKVLFITAAIESEYEARDVWLDSRRGYSVADSVRVQEIENYGRPNERLLPAGTGNGFIWRLHSIARYEERDGGVYLEVEATALTRDIPSSVGWFIRPVVNHLSINSLTTTLQQTRDAAKAEKNAGGFTMFLHPYQPAGLDCAG